MKSIPFYILPFYRLPAWAIVALGLTAIFVTAVLFVFLLGTLNGTTGNSFVLSAFRRNMPLLTMIIAYVLAGPLFETLLQHLILTFLPRLSLSLGVCLLISVGVFSLFHWQSVFYMAYTLPHGLIYGLVYLTFQYRGDQSPFLMTALTHMLFNGLVLTMQRL